MIILEITLLTILGSSHHSKNLFYFMNCVFKIDSVLVVSKDPLIGMLFYKDEGAYKFYNRYAEKIGFIVTRNNEYHHKGIVKSRVCFLLGRLRQ